MRDLVHNVQCSKIEVLQYPRYALTQWNQIFRLVVLVDTLIVPR